MDRKPFFQMLNNRHSAWIASEMILQQLEDVIEAVVRAAEQDAEDIEILASMPHPDREIIAGLAESRKRLSTLAAWLQHVREEAE